MAQPKQFGRSRTNRMFAGLCGGIAQYFNLDVNLVRLAMLFIILFSGVFPGLLFYIMAAIVIPEGDFDA